MELLLQLLIWIVEAIHKKVTQASKRRELQKEGIDPDKLRTGDEESAAEIKSKLQRLLARRVAQLAALSERGRAALDQVDGLDRDLAVIGGGRVLRGLLRDDIRPALEAGLSLLDEARKGIESLPVQRALERLEGDGRVVEAHHAVLTAVMRLEVLTAMRDTRAHPDDGYRLADADAIAGSLLEPIQQFAAAQAISLPESRPITVPAQPGGEAIWMGLLPERFPILFVPADFLSDLYRYASVPHEIGHLLWRDVPGLAQQVHAASGFSFQRGMITVRNGRIHGTIDQLYTAWMPEIFADMAAVLLLGPAGLRGLAHSFASPDEPRRVISVGSRSGQYDEHPPSHLRVHLAGHLLYAMGFDRESKVILASWDAQHGPPEHFAIPVEGGGHVQIGVESLLEPGREAMDALYMQEFAAVSGFRLADVPGFEMSPGLWAQVNRRAQQLSDDQPFNDGARVVLAAAIEARAKHPIKALVITLGLRRAILGRDADERRVADPSYRPFQEGGHAGWASEVRAAMVLREALHSRGGLAQQRLLR